MFDRSARARAAVQELHHTGRLVWPVSRTTLATIGLGSILFIAAGVAMGWVAWTSDSPWTFLNPRVLAALVGALLGAFGVLVAIRALRITQRLVLTRDGIHQEARQHGEWQTTAALPWSAVESAGTWRPVPHRSVRMVTMTLSPGAYEQYLAQLNDWGRRAAGADARIVGARSLVLSSLWGRPRVLQQVLAAAISAYGASAR